MGNNCKEAELAFYAGPRHESADAFTDFLSDQTERSRLIAATTANDAVAQSSLLTARRLITPAVT
jgi:hypothetical protein